MGWCKNDPLRAYLEQHLAADPASGEIYGVDQSLADGWLKSLAVMTTNYASGGSEAWVDTLDESIWSGSQVSARRTSLTIDHVMASAALPFFFPAVRLCDHWHGDGGVRLAAPLSPASSAFRSKTDSGGFAPGQAEEPAGLVTTSYPSPGQVAGVMLNAVFLDLLDFDALQMQRINDLLRRIPQQNWGNQRPVDVMVLRPKQDLGQIARSPSQRCRGVPFFCRRFWWSR